MFHLRHLLLLAATIAPSAFAHFTLDWPTTRGFNEDIEDQFCGGFQDASDSNNRTAFALNETTSIAIDAHHAEGSVAVFLSLSQDPKDFSDFDTSNLLFNYTDIGSGSMCLQVDPSLLDGVSNGTEATIQVQYNGGDGMLYQCADIVFSSEAGDVPSNVDCATTVESSDVTAESDAETSGDSHSNEDDDSSASPSVLLGSTLLLAGLAAVASPLLS